MKLPIEKQIPLADHTTLKVGGPARYLVTVRSEVELVEALRYAEEHTTCPPLILGHGSNILCSKTGYPGLVIKVAVTGITSEVQAATVLLTVGAGEGLDDLIEHTVEEGWWGLENLSAIPGTVGATPVQNVGAYGVEVAGRIVSVTAVHMHSKETRTFTAEECQFAYRDSFFKTSEGREWVITQVQFSLSKTPQPVLTYPDLLELSKQSVISQRDIRMTLIEIRSKKFPDWHTVGTAGSFFKNPIVSETKFQTLKEAYKDLPSYPHEGLVKIPLGYVLDKICGLKGQYHGAVGLYENQALVLVAEPSATAKEVTDFVTYVSQLVEEKTGLVIEPEVRIV